MPAGPKGEKRPLPPLTGQGDGGVYGYRNVAAPFSVGEDVLNAGVSFLR